MSFLKKLMGGSFESNRDEANALLAEGQLGEAKLAFERALGKAKGVPADQVAAVQERIRTCRLELAHARIEEAGRLVEVGEFDQAEDLLDGALEICDVPEIADAVKACRDRIESEDARRLVDENEEIDEDELISIIAGTWTDPQAEEYAAMPDTLREALLASHDGEHAQAAQLLEELVNRADLPLRPRYLYLELGKEQFLTEQYDGAVGALDAFLAKIDDGTAIGLKVAAMSLKATALSRLERYEEARDQLIQATRLAPEDHTVFLNLGVYLRGREVYDEAVVALEKAIELMGQMQPDFRVIRELGFTYLAMGRKDEAKGNLGAVIEHLASRGEHDQFDPETAVALAALQEESGDLMQAADLYRHLTVGYDTKNHFTYNLEAARLLRAAKADPSLADRYLTRAAELADGEEQVARLAQLRR
jgi:tetratricopeptide (TPR) repeat protein